MYGQYERISWLVPPPRNLSAAPPRLIIASFSCVMCSLPQIACRSEVSRVIVATPRAMAGIRISPFRIHGNNVLIVLVGFCKDVERLSSSYRTCYIHQVGQHEILFLSPSRRRGCLSLRQGHPARRCRNQRDLLLWHVTASLPKS